MKHFIISLAFFFYLSGCQTDNRDSSSDENKPHSLQSVTSEPISAYPGDIVASPIYNPNNIPIVYESSNPNAVYVDEAAQIRAVAPGEAKISVLIKESNETFSPELFFTISVQKFEQEIYFENPVSTLIVGDEINISAIATGEGEISYTSTNPDIVTIDQSGKITAVSIGSTKVLAAVQEDDLYKSTSAELQVSVGINILGWLYEDYSEIRFSSHLNQIEYWFSEPELCLLLEASQCQSQVFSSLNNTAIIENFGYAKSAYFTYVQENSEKSLYFKINSFSPRRKHTIVELEDKLFLFNGCTNISNYCTRKSDIWVSEDGVHWKELDPNVRSVSSWRKPISYQRKLWLIGSDVLSSADGINWTEENINLPLNVTSYTDIRVSGENIWLIKNVREEGSAYSHMEIWHSSNMEDWSLKLGKEDTEKHKFLTSLVFDNKIWVESQTWDENRRMTVSHIWSSTNGGEWDSTILEDSPFIGEMAIAHESLFKIHNNVIWKSDDAINWERVAESSILPFSEFAFYYFNDRFFINGGVVPSLDSSSELSNDTWISSNAINWEKKTLSNHIQPSTKHVSVASLNGSVYSYQVSLVKNALFSDDKLIIGTNELEWNDLSSDIATGRRYDESQLLAFKDELLLINLTQSNAEILRSENGNNWVNLLDYDADTYSSLVNFESKNIIVHDGEVWAFVSTKTHDQEVGHIWKTSDGRDWQELPVNPETPIFYGSVASFKNKLWYSYNSNIWYSDDGQEWIKLSQEFPFHGSSTNFVVKNDKLFAFESSPYSYIGDIGLWSTTDGTNWVNVKETLPFKGGSHNNVIIKDDHFLYFGDDGIWRSENGVKWAKRLKATLTFDQINQSANICCYKPN